jgi:Tol biopolymer transport system component
MEGGWSWKFRTRLPQLLFLRRPDPGAELRQLFLASYDGMPLRQLTDHPRGVWDYAVHPQGQAVVYSVLREDGGSDLWHMDRDGGVQSVLLACPEGACLNPVWSPDGRQLAYERRDIWAGAPNLDPQAGHIWLLDLEEGEERPLFDYDVAVHSPVWGPDGQRLAYVSPLLPGVEVCDLQTQELQQFSNEWGEAPVWSPDGRWLVLPELMLAGESLVVRLVRIDLDAGEMADISGDDDFVKDVSPAWSPGGGWIAFGRQLLDDERWTPGRQIWLTRPDASEAYVLFDEPMGDHFALAWRPDGAALAYALSNLSQGPQPVPDVSVWVFDLVARAQERIAGDAVLPRWLP